MDEAVICPGCGCAVTGGNVAQSNNNGEETSGLATAAIVFAILMPIIGLILGIVGACKYKSEELKKKSVAAIAISICVWIVSFCILMAMGM